MDKYEYKLKSEQMLEFMEDGEYSKAAEIADTIDWRRVRNATMLMNVSDIYEKNREYQKSYDILMIAYQRAEGSRKILYRLCVLALKTKNVDEAIDYYDEFIQIAPKDPNRYLLRYQILRARNEPIEQQIEALEAFKKGEYIEEWAYELAKLYQEAGMTAECLEECDDLILWFSEGKYVYQAMELKMQYKPLTPSQQEKYNRRYEKTVGVTEEIPDVTEYQEKKSAGGEIGAEKIEETDDMELPEVDSENVPVRKIGNTMKLDEALKVLLHLEPSPDQRDTEDMSSLAEQLAEEDAEELPEEELSGLETAMAEIEAVSDAPAKEETIADVSVADVLSINQFERKAPRTEMDRDLEELVPEPEEPVVPETPSADSKLEELVPEPDLEALVSDVTAQESKDDDQVEGQLSFEDILQGWQKNEQKETAAENEKKPIEVTSAETEAETAAASEAEVAAAETASASKAEVAKAETASASGVGSAKAETMTTNENETDKVASNKVSASEETDEEPILPPDILKLIEEIENGIPAEHEEEPGENLQMNDLDDFEDYDEDEDDEFIEEFEEETFEDLEAEAEEAEELPEAEIEIEVEEAEELPEEEIEIEAEEAEELPEEEIEIEAEEAEELSEDEIEIEAEEAEELSEEEIEIEAEETEELSEEEPEIEAEETEELPEEEPEIEAEETEELPEDEVGIEEPETVEMDETGSEDAFLDALDEEFSGDSDEEFLDDFDEDFLNELASDAANESEPQVMDDLPDSLFEEKYEEYEEPEEEYEEEEETYDEPEEEYAEEEETYEEPEEEYEEEEETYEEPEEKYEEEEETYEEPEEEFEETEVTLEELEDEPEQVLDDREIPDEDDDDDKIHFLSETAPLSRKETAKLYATGKTAPIPIDEISDALSMSDTGFVVHGRYDLKVQSGIGTRAGLTEDQKKLFSYFVPVRGMSEQLVDVLEQDKHCTNRQGTSSTGNLLIIGNKGNGKTVLAVDVVKAIQKQRNIRQGRVAIVSGDSLNKKRISDIFTKLYGGALIIEKAGKMNEKTVARLNKAMEQDSGELLVVLEDQRKPLDRLLTSNREFRRKFTSRLEVPVLINDELVTFGQTYAKENGYLIDEMGILALYSRIDELQREDHPLSIAEVKEVMDEAMEHSQKVSAKKLMRRVLGRGKDSNDRIILGEADFM